MSRGFKFSAGFLVAVALICTVAIYFYGLQTLLSKLSGPKSVAERIEETQSSFDRNLAPLLKEAGLSLQPTQITLVFFKDEKRLHLFAGDDGQKPKLIKSFAVTAASGKVGPKLREGDRQVPEGVYRIESLNPNSRFYLSLRVNYPNEDDRVHAKAEGRTQLGSDIMIHGSNVSIGCIAIGDKAIAELFHLAATTDYSRWRLLLAPTDLRLNPPPPEILTSSPWMRKVYEKLNLELMELP